MTFKLYDSVAEYIWGCILILIGDILFWNLIIW